MKEQIHWRGDIWMAALGERVGSEQAGWRPVIIIQNNTGNKFSPTVIVACITKTEREKLLPTQVRVTKEEANLHWDSVIMLEQIRTVDKSLLAERMTHLSTKRMLQVNAALLASVLNSY